MHGSAAAAVSTLMRAWGSEQAVCVRRWFTTTIFTFLMTVSCESPTNVRICAFLPEECLWAFLFEREKVQRHVLISGRHGMRRHRGGDGGGGGRVCYFTWRKSALCIAQHQCAASAVHMMRWRGCRFEAAAFSTSTTAVETGNKRWQQTAAPTPSPTKKNSCSACVSSSDPSVGFIIHQGILQQASRHKLTMSQALGTMMSSW